jgi:hypothetical protein
VHKLCLQLKDSPSEHPLVLEPRNILLTAGEVRVVPGSHGGDPLVIQVGRLLRMLLLNKPVPPELRLIMSQATFELPIFDSVEDVARALAAVSRGPENDAVESAYGKALRPVVATPFETVSDLPAPRPILPVPRRRRRALTSRFPYSKDDVLLAATVLVGAAVCVGLIANQWISRTQITVRPTTNVITSTAENRRPVAGPPAVTSPAPQNGAPTAVPPLRVGSTQDRARPVPSRPAQQPAGTASTATALPMPVVVRSEGGRPTPREMARRAAALVEAGKPSEAEVAFDAFVLNNPLYEPAPSELGPEAYAALEASRKVVLPKIAIRDFGRAKTALEQGNVDGALAIASDVDAVLDRAGSEAPPGLRSQVQELVDAALDARTATDGIIYTDTDVDVIAPRALSRQFPLKSPEGIRPDRVGVLEIIVGKQGDVEFVKLHTPLNRYHERMVVSAAKAWRYRPARKGGTPVRYRLNVTVNLPESGT